jgi:hypothetical protein
MRVVCDSCGATYKIPDTKLVKDVNRATCRKCGHRMLIRKPDAPVGMGTYPSAATEEERTVIASAADLERRAREHLAAAQAATGARLGTRPPHAEEDPTIVKTLAASGSGTGLSVGRSKTEVPAAPARIQRRQPDEMPTTVSSSIERMPERHVSQSLGPAQPIPHAPRPPVEDGLKSGAVFDAPRSAPTTFDSPRGAPASFDSPRGAPASFDAPRGGGGFDPNADAARRAAAGRQAVVIDQAMRPPVPVAPVPQPAPAPHGVFPNGGAGAAMPAPMTPVAAPPQRSAMSGVVVGAVLLALLCTAGAAAYIFTRTPVEESPERVDKVTTEAPAEEAPAEAAPAEAAPPEEAAPAEAVPEPTPDVAEAAPPPEPEPVAVEKAPEPPPKPSTRSSRSSSRSSSASKSTAPVAASAIEIPETPPATKPAAATKTTAKTTSPEVSDDDLLGSTTPASKPAPAVVPPPPVPDDEPEVLDTLPLTVLDTIVRNNKNIKRCFFNEQQKTGVLPSVSVKMKIETSGSVSSAAIAEPAAQQGTELDACLSTAFKGLQFPAFKTPMGAVTYPFKF